MKTVTPGGFNKSRLGFPYVHNNGTSDLPRPVIVSPDNGSIVRVSDLQLTWEQNPEIGTTGWYEVQVSTHPNYPNDRAVTNQFATVSSLFNPNLVEYSALSRWLIAPWLPRSRLPKPDRYYWRVRSGNSTPDGVVYGQWSDTSRFVGDPLPDEYTFSLIGSGQIRMSGFTGSALGRPRVVSGMAVKPSVETRISQRVNAPISSRSIEYINTVQHADGMAAVVADLTYGQWSYIAVVLASSGVTAQVSVRHDQGVAQSGATVYGELIYRAAMNGYVRNVAAVRAAISKYPEDFLPVTVAANTIVSGNLGHKTNSVGTAIGVGAVSADAVTFHQLTCAALSASSSITGRIALYPHDFDDVTTFGDSTATGSLAVTEQGPMLGLVAGYATLAARFSGTPVHVSVALFSGSSVTGSLGSPQVLSGSTQGGSFNYCWIAVTPFDGNPEPSPPWYEHIPGGSPEVAPPATPELSNWNIGPLWNRHTAYMGAHTPSLLPKDTGVSQGCSRLLRYFLNNSGIAYRILSEFRADYVTSSGLVFYAGDHGNGDAIDITGQSGTVINYQIPTVRGQRELDTLARWVKQYAHLFTVAIYSSANPELSVQIRNGKPYEYADEVLKLHRNHIHLASSLTWLQDVLSPPLWMSQTGETSSTTDGQLVVPSRSRSYV
jgi:hypothetical protein